MNIHEQIASEYFDEVLAGQANDDARTEAYLRELESRRETFTRGEAVAGTYDDAPYTGMVMNDHGDHTVSVELDEPLTHRGIERRYVVIDRRIDTIRRVR
jgi:hypothetical protein